jgi:hypothetical protein
VIPDAVELLTFFASEATEQSVEDGHWAYESVDRAGVHLRLSFNVFERSVQTELSVGGRCISMVSHEGAVRMTIENDELRCEFSCGGCRSTVLIRVGDALCVRWNTIRTQ